MSNVETQKILIIDDNKSISTMFAKMLELEGYRCIVANDGRNGLSLLETEDFKAVFLDIAMPEFSGVDIINALEKSGKLKKHKIIILTASSISDEELEKLKTMGIFSILKKPIDSDLILEQLGK